MGAKPRTAALSGNDSWIKHGLLTTLFVLVLVSLVYSAPVPDNEEGLNGNNDLASGEATDEKTNLDDGFDEFIGSKATDTDENAKPKETEETEVIYRTQTQGITLPHFVFTTGPTTLPPIPKITTYHPVPMQTTPRPDEEELHIDIQGVMTRPPGGGVFTTAHVPEPAETTETTASTTTTAEDAGGVLIDVVDIDTKDEDKEETEPSSTTTTTAVPETTVADSAAVLVGEEKEEDLEPIDKLIEMDDSSTTTTTVPTTTTVSETTAVDGGVILVGGEKEEDLEPIDKLLEMDTTTTTSAPTTTTTEEVTEAVAAGGAVLVGAEKAEDETTTTTQSTTQSTTPVMVVIVDGGEDEEPSSSTTTTTTTTTMEPTTESVEKSVYPGIVDTDKKTDDDVVYTTPTTTAEAYTTKLPTEEPSSTTTMEVVPIAKVGLKEPERKENRTNDDEQLQKIVVSIDAEPTVVVDLDDDAVNGTLIGESKSDGLTNGARTGIAIACIVAFWLILGPIVCCICKMRDKKRDKKEQEERNAREKASNHLVEEMVKAELQKQPNGDHKQNGDYKKNQYKDEKPYDESEFEPITLGHSDSVPYIDADAESRDTEL